MSETMRRELNDLKKTVASTNETLASTNKTLASTNATLHRVVVSVAQLTGDFAEFKNFVLANMATKNDISLLNERMDGFSGLLLDSRHRWAVHAETLSSHDERLKKLENKPS